MSPTFSSLRTRNYRLYASGMLVSNVGTWMQRVAQDWLVLQLTHGSGLALGITTGLQFLPMLIFGLWGGMLADRYRKRLILTITQTLMGVIALVLGLLVISDSVAVWQVYVLATLLGLATAVDNPARQSFVIEMVGSDDLTNAVSLNSASFNMGRVLGPATAGLLISLWGTGPVFVINAASFLAVLVALRAMRDSELFHSPLSGRGRGQVRAGLAYVRGRPDLLVLLMVVFFVGTFGLNFQLTTALMATHTFGKGAGQYGLLGSIMAIGSLTGALLAARRGRPRLRLMLGAAALFGAFEMAAGSMPTYWLFAFSLIPVGITSMTFITAANSTMQLAVDPVMRGRVMALYMAVFMGGTPFGAPLIGGIAELLGPRWSLWVGGGITMAAAGAGALLMMRSRGLVLRTTWSPLPAVRVVEQPTLDAVR